MRGVAAGVGVCVECKGGDAVDINVTRIPLRARTRRHVLGLRVGESSVSGVTPVCPAISEKVKTSASGATCVRCSSEPAATKQSRTPASSTSMTSASSLMPRS